MQEDYELIRQYLEGDMAAFEELYRRYSSMLYGYIFKKLRSKEPTEEIFQQVFLKIHKNREKYKPELSFKVWLFVICRNTIIDYFRKNKNDLNLKHDVESNISSLIQENNEGDIYGYEEVMLGVLKLPDLQRRALELRFKKDLEFEEIAKELQTSSENARQLVSRGVRKLKNKLGF